MTTFSDRFLCPTCMFWNKKYRGILLNLALLLAGLLGFSIGLMFDV